MRRWGWFAAGMLVGAFTGVRWTTKRFHLITPVAVAPMLVHPWRLAYRAPERLVQLLDVAPDHHILEVGCGNGALLKAFAEAVPRGLAVGIDLQWGMLARAQGRAAAAALCRATALRLPFADASFDRVVLIAVLPMIAARAQALQEVRRVLKPSGALLVGEEWLAPEFVPWHVARQWVEAAGFRLEQAERNWLSYALRFTPTAASASAAHFRPK